MKKSRLVVWIIGLLVLGLGHKSWAQTLDVASAEPTALLANYLIDETDTKNISDIALPVTRWKQSPGPVLTLGFLPHPVWCRFTIQQKSSAPRVYALELTNYYADSVTLYQPLSGQSARWKIQHSGDGIPFVQHNPQSRYPAFYIQLPDNKTYTFYARIKFNQYHEYQFQVWNKASFLEHQLPDPKRYLYIGAVIMLLIFQVGMLIFMYPYRVLRSYALFSVAYCLCGLCAMGIPVTYFPRSPYWVNVSHYVTLGMVMPTLANYVVQALYIRTYSKPVFWLYRLFQVIGLAYVVFSFFARGVYTTQGFAALMSVLLLFTTLLLLVMYIQGARPAIWNVLALVFILPPYGYFYGHRAGLFGSGLSEWGIWLTFCINILTEPVLVILLLWQATRERIQSKAKLSQEKARNENLQELDQLKTNFFNNISHELRTPVTLLVWPLQTLQTRFPSDHIYAMMYRNVRRLQTLINQLLDLAKLDAGQIKAAPAPGDLVADVRSWVDLFQPAANQEGVQLILKQDQSQWFALYDPDKMEKIITNLLSNALKFTSINKKPEGTEAAKSGIVTVQATYLPTGVTITVTDTGTGIEREAIPHLFDRFYQAKKSPTSGYFQNGSGVGLALVHELVKLLGGTIQVWSTPGEGSTFRVWMPMKQTEEQPITLPKALPGPIHSGAEPETNRNGHPVSDSPDAVPSFTPAEHENQPKPLLLLVEDNPDLRLQLREILAPYYELREATDGQQGLEMALEALPDLIVTDLVMPRLDGLELCRALRADSRTDHIPVIMLTAKAAIKDRLTGLETGADDYLTKPFLPAELLIRLQNLGRRQEALRSYWQRKLTQTTPSPIEAPDGTLPELNKPGNDGSERFLNQLYEQLELHLDQPDFDVEQLASQLAMSSRTLNRKLKAVLGISAREMIWNYRLRHAQELLRADLSPTDVTYMVGFSSLSSFSRAYNERYGHRPSAEKS